MNMKEMLKEYFGETLITTQGRQREEQERRKKILDRIYGYFEENGRMHEGKTAGRISGEHAERATEGYEQLRLGYN